MDQKQKSILGLKQSIANRRRELISLECQGDQKQFKDAKTAYSRLIIELKKITRPEKIDLLKAGFFCEFTGPELFEN